MQMGIMKEDIRRIIEDLHFACRQPLFNGIVGRCGDGGKGSPPYKEAASSKVPVGIQSMDRPSSKRQRTENIVSSDKTKSWDTILAEASSLLPLMTSHEHGQASRLVGILLLGFFLPHSTGNLFFSSQNLSTQTSSVSSRYQNQKGQYQSSGTQTAEGLSDTQHVSERYVAMSLEERLECSAHRYGNEFGELDDLIVHQHLENAFRSFLKIGLRPFLLGRPAHATEVDLIHILAMAIHPRPSDQCIRKTTTRLEDQKSDIWETTVGLMSSLVPNSFNINYRHRFELVRIVLDCLVLPECQQEAGICQNAPLFEGAIPHLRASLYAFGMASTSLYDNHLAQRAMVSLAIQSRIEHVIKEEWSRLLHRLVDDRTNYNDNANLGTSSQNFCPHTSRGVLLRDFLIKSNQARRFADEDFLQYALGSLTDAIEMQVDCWTKEEAENDEDSKEAKKEVGCINQPPQVLASLLSAATNLFHFLLPLKSSDPVDKEGDDENEEMEESDDSHYRDMLISCCIQLVHHWDPVIIKKACTLLILAFSYSEDMWEDYVGAVFDSVVIAIDVAMKRSEDQGSSVVSIEGLVSAFSQRSLTFAVNLSKLLLKEKSTGTNPLVAFRLIAAIANARPAVVHEHRDALVNQLNTVQDPSIKKHILASILSCRKTHYFANDKDSAKNLSPLISSQSLGNWDCYLISRHAMLTGNFDVAKELYGELKNSASSESTFVWLSAMEKVADGEGRLCTGGGRALLESSSKLRMAIATFRSIKALNQVSTSFQIKLLELRVSYLDLVTNIRQLTVEMRLVGAEPKKFTRPHLHMKKMMKLVFKLGVDHMKLYKKYGLFLCQQSRSVLRTLYALCSFIAKASSRVFSDSIVFENNIGHKSLAGGDVAQPLSSLLKQLDSFALEKVDPSIDAKVRAVTLLEILDGILRTPVPIPRFLIRTNQIPFASLELFSDPDVHDNGSNRLKILSGTKIVCVATGVIPTSLTKRSRIPFNVILLWYTLEPKGSSTNATISANHSRIEGGPIATSISPSGSFFVRIKSQVLLNEGHYDLKFRLGCRDIRGGEWDLPLQEDPPVFSVKVLQSESK